ncbi:hypothetical protein [Halobacillus amylolyticus]|uniref:Phage protein n=1 Tax=Halobacillus amylolyticus TaxID=2932259 RepID=A0ABY4HFJ3_9BACI|nr:hypothetical protein [Halobacillus amylolyticus]UOR13658.1 hypothetical protein MUO15_09545 [Halobacillus amylolyticus]
MDFLIRGVTGDYIENKFNAFLSSVKEEKNLQEVVMKTFESNIRPVEGDIIDDPGFHPQFHNGYEVAKVTITYASDECWVSLNHLR